MSTYDFWYAQNQGRPISEYLEWLAQEWSDFVASTEKAFPALQRAITTGSKRYEHFENWLEEKRSIQSEA